MRQIFFLILVLFMPFNAGAELFVDLKQGVSKPLPIAVTKFYKADPQFSEMASGLSEIIAKNLKGSGLFETINNAAFVQDDESIDANGLGFAEWRATGAQGVISGVVRATEDGRPRVEFR